MNETTANYRLQSYAEREAAEKARWGKALAKPTTTRQVISTCLKYARTFRMKQCKQHRMSRKELLLHCQNKLNSKLYSSLALTQR